MLAEGGEPGVEKYSLIGHPGRVRGSAGDQILTLYEAIAQDRRRKYFDRGNHVRQAKIRSQLSGRCE
jgi:hypothetical protein